MTRALCSESFRAMGTICAVRATAGALDEEIVRRTFAAARREVALCEAALSRFDPDSDLSRLNRGSGSWVAIGTRLTEALSAALRARAETHGRFDPTILPALAAAGYDRSFEKLGGREPRTLHGWRPGAQVDLDANAGCARIEEGAAVDLGGIGKGFAATRAVQTMRAAWPGMTGALVDLGGDMGIWGAPPEGGLWRIDIADPRAAGRVLGTLELRGGGVATSGRDTRRFGPGGRLHHLIDPRTGAPANAGPLAVTVVAPSAAEAEIQATALAVMGRDEAFAHLASRPDLGALLVPDFGDPVAIGHLPLARKPHRLRFTVNA